MSFAEQEKSRGGERKSVRFLRQRTQEQLRHDSQELFNFEANVDINSSDLDCFRSANNLSSVVNKPHPQSILESVKDYLKNESFSRRVATPNVQMLQYDGNQFLVPGSFDSFKEKMSESVFKYEQNQKRGTTVCMSNDEKNIDLIKVRIPIEYFQEEFRLPDGFFIQNSQLEVNFETNAILNDHLELVDLQLFKKVARTKTDLFNSFIAMISLKKHFRNSEVTIESLRGNLKQAKQKVSSSFQKVTHLLAKKKHLKELQVQLQIMKALRITLPTIEENIKTESYSIALEVMQQAEEMTQNKLENFKGAKIFQLEMKELRQKLKNKLEKELFLLTQEYFQARVCTKQVDSPHMTTVRDLEHMIDKYFNDVKEDLEINLIAKYWKFGKDEPYQTVLQRCQEIVANLIRMGDCGTTLVRAKELFVNLFKKYHSQMKNILYNSMVESYPEFDCPKSQIFANLDFFSHLQAIITEFMVFGTLIKSMRSIRSLFSKGMQKWQEQIRSKSEADYKAKRAFIKTYFEDIEVNLSESFQECEKFFANKLAKLLSAREEKLNSLSVHDFSTYYTVVNSIVKYLPKRMSRQNFEAIQLQFLGLKTTFAEAITRAKENEITQSLDNQMWEETTQVALQFHCMIKFISNPAYRQLAAVEADINKEELEGVTGLACDGRNYHVTPSSLVMLKIMYEFLRLMRIVENLSSDLTNKMLLLLKRYNSRLTQLILGAGAISMGQLKNITTKHLCMSVEAISLFMVQIPSIVAQVKISVGGSYQGYLLAEYDKLRSDFHNHLNELYKKLAGILTQRIEFHLKDAVKIDWNKPAKNLETQDYMSRLMKEVKRMHKILLGLLTVETTVQIFFQGLSEAIEIIRMTYSDITIKNKFAAARLHVDIQSFIQVLSELDFPESISSPISSKLRQVIQQRGGQFLQEFETQTNGNAEHGDQENKEG